MLTFVLPDYLVHEYIATHWSNLFPENPNRIDLCLKLGYSVLTRPVKSESNVHCWHWIVIVMRRMGKAEEVISLLSTPAARASLVNNFPGLAPFAHDPLLIACYCNYTTIMEYMIQTASPDVQRFNEALRVCAKSWQRNICECCINARLDMQVNSDGVVVAVDPDGGEGEVKGKSFVYLFVGGC